METAEEKRQRVNRFSTWFYKEMLKGTVAHCRKLYNANMSVEALDILEDFTGKSRSDCLTMIMTGDMLTD